MSKISKNKKKLLKTKELLLTREASEYTGLSVNRLNIRRCEGLPPRYFKVDRRVFYKVRELDSFLKTYPEKRGCDIERLWYDDEREEYDDLDIEDRARYFYGPESVETLTKARILLKVYKSSKGAV